MNLLENIFYLLIVFPLIYELTVLCETQSVINYKKRKKERENQQKEQLLTTNSHGTSTISVEKKSSAFIDLLFNLFSLGYAIWTILGLFTSEWVLFLIILLLAVTIPSSWRYNKTLLKIDALLSFIILLFAVINHMHLHYRINPFDLINP